MVLIQPLVAQQWLFNGTNAYYNTGNVGIGTTNPTQKLSVQGPAGSNVVDMALRNGDGTSLLTFSTSSAGESFITSYYGINFNSLNTPAFYQFKIGGVNVMRIQNNVGIGTTSPSEKLDVNGNIKSMGFILPTGAGAGKVLTSDANGNASWQAAAGGSSGWAFNGSAVGSLKSIGTTDNFDLPIVTNNVERMRILANGAVAIGTTTLPSPSAMLAVKGNIHCQKVRVSQNDWADYVFENNYPLLPLGKLNEYIREHRHLPEVPTAEEVKKSGIDLGDNQVILLKKIEELTLYLIEQDKVQKDQRTILLELSERIQRLETENSKLKKLACEKAQ